MCGIAGKYNFLRQTPVSPNLMERMCERIWYRGPDDSGVYTQGPVGLGHRRLSILDLSELGHQPMASPDQRLWITYNGEVYNFLSLREGLIQKGYRFKSDCDTEVILALYQEYGRDCLEYLRGMFAFAIWDARENTLFLARDRIGKKPLFYYYDGRTLVFASEIKAILADEDVTPAIDFQAFADYFKHMYVPDPKTIYKDIRKLEPGHFLCCSPEGLKNEPYWDISFAEPRNGDTEELAFELLQRLEESVRLRLISDVPLGAFLSGGIDSSGIVALMAGQQTQPVTTCSIGFDVRQYDEVRFARRIAEQFATDHHEFTVKERAAPILSDLAYYFDEPFADPSAVPTFYVSQLARQKVTVALSGDGGDENFAGYEKYHLDHIENRLRGGLPLGLRRLLFPYLAALVAGKRAMPLQKAYTLLTSLSGEADFGFYLTNTQFDHHLWTELIRPEIDQAIQDYDPFSVTRAAYHQADTEDHLSRILYTDLKTYLPGDILVKVDRMSMANSLEVRAPILDHRVIELAASIPSHLKYFKGEKKYILKQALQKVLPPEIMYRQKMGFSVPLAEWFRGELRQMAHDRFFSPRAGVRHFFRPEALKALWERHQSKKRNHASVLWSLLMFDLWYQRFMR